MTDQQLREELHRIADSAPSAYVPADLFARGRRAHRRSLTIVAASVAAAVALIAGAVALAPTRDSAEVDPARSRADLAVPDTIYAAPTWLAETEDGRYTHIDELEQDLAIGVGAIAYVRPADDASAGVAVVIDADDGDYHPLFLPDFIALDPYWRNGTNGDVEHQPLALSPDGQHLAWAWGMGRDAGPDGATPGGVRVADLTTGEVVEWDLATAACPATGCDDRGTYVSDLKWSEGGRQLLWTGSRMDQWDAQAYVPGARVAGVIHLASASMTPYQGGIDNQGELSTWAVSDDGAIAFNGDPGPDLHLQGPDGKPSTLVRPELASIGEPILYRGNDLYISSEDGLIRVDGSGATYATPDDTMWRAVGWVGDGPLLELYGSDDIYFGQVWEVGPTPDNESAGGSSLISLGDDAGSTVADTTSIAYDLIDTGSIKHPTVHRSKPFFRPPWASTAAFWLFVGGLVAAIMWRRRAAARMFAVVAVVALVFGVAGVMLIDRSAFTSGSDGQDDTDRLVKVSPTVSTDAPSPARAEIPWEIRWTDNPEKHVPVSESLAVGRATLAFADDAGLMGGDRGSAAVITVDGDYRRLDLPDIDEASIIGGGWAAVQLSPDGARLAYVTGEGLNVVDLETGKVAEHDLDLTRGRVTSFAWSPNSGWLVWDSDYEHRAAGRIAPDGTAEPLPDDHWENAGIGNDGTVAVRTESGTRMWPDGAAVLPGTESPVASIWVGPDASAVRSVGSRQQGEAELAIGRSPKVRGVDVDGRHLLGVAGWLSDGTPIITTQGEDDIDLRTVDPDGSTHKVARVDSYVAGLSVATALPADTVVTPPHPTWGKPIPLWPILVIAGIVAATGFFVWRWVRRARRAGY
ncbi:hypothetical protein ACFV9G_04860 [Nocardioides sp. NPDC059952]|uniref:hypothetical protein n=1 Tax=Nocardioides sp. NPDC059952 TaxID=3347014 RepID=UPI003653AB28